MDWVSVISVISVILALTVPGVVLAGYLNRRGKSDDKMKGIGWQIIRYTVIGMALPIAGILALNGVLTGEAATIIAGAMGYAFGQSAKDG